MTSEERGGVDETGAVTALDEAGNPISEDGGPDPAQVGDTLRRAGVLMEALPGGGIALVFPRMRHPGAAVGSAVFLVLNIGAVALTIVLGLPVLFPVVIGVSLLFPLWLTLTFCLAQSRVEVGRRGISLRSGIFGAGAESRLDFADIAGFDVRETVKVNNHPYYSVVVLRRGGGKGPRVAGLLRISAAQAVIDALETAIRDYGGGLPGGE